MLNNSIKRTNNRLGFCKRFWSLTKERRPGDVWADFIVSTFCSYAFPENEVSQAELFTITERYSLKEQETLAEMYVLLDKLLAEYTGKDFWESLQEDLKLFDMESPYNIPALQHYITPA